MPFRLAFPNFGNRLKWRVEKAPSWLEVSPSNAAGDTLIDIHETGQAQPGAIGYIELQTVPPFAAPSVEAGPLRIKVEVLSKFPPSGVLLAGGHTWGNEAAPARSAEVWDPSTGKISLTSNNMSTEREYQTATQLKDGTVLVAGGQVRNYNNTALADIYDPKTTRFTPTNGYMTSDRSRHTATLLPNGKVLLTGGCCGPNGDASLKTAELYDPATGTFSATGDMHTARQRHTATLLSDGIVLITGGAKCQSDTTGLTEAELYDPRTGQFTPTGSLNVPREGQSATLLANGDVIIAGGTKAEGAETTAELYVPANGAFARTGLTGAMAARRINQIAIALPNGKVLLDGGTKGSDTAEFYDPPPSFFYFTPSAPLEKRDMPSGTLVTGTGTALDGQVLIAGGVVANSGRSNGTQLELFDPKTESFRSAGKMSTSRSGMTATLFTTPLQ